MKNNIEERKIEWLESFNKKTYHDNSFDLYEVLSNSDENLRKYWELISEFYYISCLPFDKFIKSWKKTPEIYDILKRYKHTANWYPLEILIWKYSEETMAKARKITEEKRKEYEWMWFTFLDPKEYMYIVGFFGWTSWRNNQYIIKEIKDAFPEKIRIIKDE